MIVQTESPTIDHTRIPEELRKRHQWVLWRSEERDGKATKVPYQPNGKHASTTRAGTWSSFTAVWLKFSEHPGDWSGIGFVFAADDPYIGIDLDLCMTPDRSFLADWAEDALEHVPSYAEVSPSGRGIKILARADYGGRGRTFTDLVSIGEPVPDKRAELCIYGRGRYFAITGDVYEDHDKIVDCQAGVDRLVRSYWPEEKAAKPRASHNIITDNAGHSNGEGVDRRALEAMLRIKMEDGGDGSKRLYTCACRVVEHDLSDAVAVSTIRAYGTQHPFPKDWTDQEILHRVRDAEKRVERGSAIVIANYETIEVEGEDGEAQKIIEAIPIGDIIGAISRRTGDWPRRVDNVLFVDDPQHGVDWFDRRTTAGLFGWLRRRCKVDWKGGGKLVSQAELFAELERTAEKYDAIEAFPHEPPMERHYYRCKPPTLGDGSALGKLLDRFRPETTIDRDLIQAAFLTPFWGGPVGCRPAFVITSDAGRGVGKTKLAECIAHLTGGFIDVSAGEDIATLKQRFLSPEGQSKRIAFLDNVKSLRFSWAELESLITTPTISGKRLYIGEGQRPNTITWLMTLNGVSLATDLAQRSVIIKLAKGRNSGPWYEETVAMIREHRHAIIGDICAALRGEQFALHEFTRWAAWEQGVLSRLPEPSEAQRVILDRQAEANCEQDEAEIIEEHFGEQLRKLSYDPDRQQVRIPVAIAARWYGWAVGEQTKTAAASKRLRQMSDEGQLQRIKPEPSRKHGRCFLWIGEHADISATIASDLAERLALRSEERSENR